MSTDAGDPEVGGNRTVVLQNGYFGQYAQSEGVRIMKRLSAAEAKNAFGHLLDLARHEPVLIEKHNRPVIVVMSIEEYDRLTGGTTPHSKADDTKTGKTSVS